MTQDQYGQTRGPGYVVRDDAVPDEENEEYAAGQSKPKTAFQKVASALRGDQDEAAMDEQPGLPGGRLLGPARDGRDRSGRGGRDHQPGRSCYPDVPATPAGPDADATDHPATEPDMFGANSRAGNGATSAPYPEGQAGTATTADVLANGTQANRNPRGVPRGRCPRERYPGR